MLSTPFFNSMKLRHRCRHALAVIVAVAGLAASAWASADPPARVARLGYLAGAVSFSPAGEGDWVQATLNRPLTSGDRLWTAAADRSRTEIQVGGATMRMDVATGIAVLNLDDEIVQVQLTQGTLNVRVLGLAANQVFEVATPNLAFTLRKPGEYRIEVDPDGSATTIIMRKGQGEVYGDHAVYAIDAQQPYRFTGTSLREYEPVHAPRIDEFDRWSSDRDRSYDESRSARYVSAEVIGYQDLDANGTWRNDADYGNVWIPDRVAAQWAPYRDGHWAWIDPWGWTWVDDAPWGFAVSHYGRWASLGGTWAWVPGPVSSRAYYAPALVAFVGGNNFQLSTSSGNARGVAWFPLAPREIYRPAYPVSRGYFENVNRSNTVINDGVLDRTYHNADPSDSRYANRNVPGAVVAIPAAAFVRAQPARMATVGVSIEKVAGAPVVIAPPLVPTETSVRDAAPRSGKLPPFHLFERPVLARKAPPARPLGLAAQLRQLATKPGQPLDAAARKGLQPPASLPAPIVKVVTPTHEAPAALRLPPEAVPTAEPPAAKPVAKSELPRPLSAPKAVDSRSNERGKGKIEPSR